MEALPFCPLDPDTFLLWPRPMGYDHLQAITNHVSTGNCPLPHPPLKELVFDGPLIGTTLLLLACQYGELESVKYIVDSLEVDVNAPAPYYFHPISNTASFSATPIFVAAFLGYSKIVHFLLEKGADANVKTSNEAMPILDGLTPLYGAVFEFWRLPNQQLNELREERHSVVLALLEFGANPSEACEPPNCSPIWMKRLCGVDTTRALINHGMDLKLHSHSGTTMLHYWASLPSDYTEQDSLAIVKLLAEKGADLMAKDKFGLTPILRAARALGRRSNWTVLDFLLDRDDIRRIEKIEALELAGATILMDPGNSTQFQKAFEYLRQATRRRHKRMRRSGPCHKTVRPNSGGPAEWTTSKQLERVIQHPSEYVVQAFLINLRILSTRNWTVVASFLADYFTGPTFQNMLAEEKSVERFYIEGATMDTLLQFLPIEKSAWTLAVTNVIVFVQTLGNLERTAPTPFYLEAIERSLFFILEMEKFRLSDGERNELTETNEAYYTNALFLFLYLLLGLPETLKKKWEWLHQLLHQWRPDQLGSILLKSFKDWEGGGNEHVFNYFYIIHVLLEAGADPNAIDKVGDGPLHAVARMKHQQSEAAGCLLLGFGANLHRRNNAGKTAMDLWIERNEKEDHEEAARLRHRPDWCRAVPKLQCLGARCVRAHHVPYSKLPTVFHSFVKNH